MAVGDILQLKVVGRLQSQNIVNTMAFEVTAQACADVDLCEELCNAFVADLEALWLGRHSEDYTLVGYKCFSYKVDAPLVPGQVVSGDAGSVVADSLPATIARTITLYCEGPDPKHRGRVMIAGTTADMLDDADGGVTAAEVALMQTLADALVASIDNGAGDEFIMRVWGALDGIDTAWDIAKAKARRTPANIRSRRIRELLIG